MSTNKAISNKASAYQAFKMLLVTECVRLYWMKWRNDCIFSFLFSKLTICVKSICQVVNSDVSFIGFKHIIEDFRGSKKENNSSVIRLKGEFQNGGNKKTKHAKFSRRLAFLTLWYSHVRLRFALLPYYQQTELAERS